MLESKRSIEDHLLETARLRGEAAPSPSALPDPAALVRAAHARGGAEAGRRMAALVADELPAASLGAALPMLDDATRARVERALGLALEVRLGPGGEGADVKATGAAAVRLVADLPSDARAAIVALDVQVEDEAALGAAEALGAGPLPGVETLEVASQRPDAALAVRALVRAAPRLAELHVRCRSLDDEAFSAIGAARGLRSLLLTVALGDAGWRAIAALAGLERLDLFGWPLKPKELGALAGLRKLRALRVASAGLPKTAMKEVTKLGALEELDLAGSERLGDAALAQIEKLPGLRRLVLTNTGAGGATAKVVASLSALEALDLGHNPGIDDAAARSLSACEHLARLDVRYCGLGAAGLEAVASHAGLLDLRVTGGRRSKGGLAAGLGRAARLAVLVAGGLMLDDADLRAIAALGSLTELRIGSTGIDATGAERLAGLAVVALGAEKNPLGAAGMRALCRLPRVSWLDVTEAGVDASGLADVGALAHLRFLHAGNNAIGDGVRHLAALTRLRELYLPESGLGDDAGAALAPLGELRELVVYGNAIGDAGAARFAELHALRLLSLQDNPVGAATIERLRGALPSASIER
jgi:hypothetical protein